MRTLLIDADILAFKHAAPAQKTYEWEEGVTSVSVEPIEQVTPRVDRDVAALKSYLKADEVIICLSCPTEQNFRLDVLRTYKGNRDYSKRPLLLGSIKAHLADNYRSYRKDTLEADDIMGILSTHPTLVPGEKIIVSADKDMRCIPGLLFNPEKDTRPRRITEVEADLWHLHQTLMGDPTDNYSGCPGIGKVRAAKVLTENPTWAGVVETYRKVGLSEADALVQARVARICRHTDYDFKEKKVILWNPPKQ